MFEINISFIKKFSTINKFLNEFFIEKIKRTTNKHINSFNTNFKKIKIINDLFCVNFDVAEKIEKIFMKTMTIFNKKKL